MYFADKKRHILLIPHKLKGKAMDNKNLFIRLLG